MEERDGPTDEYRRHHPYLSYLAGTAARRRLWMREQLAVRQEISPEACEAGGWFAEDYLIGVVGRSNSSLDVRFGGSGGRGREINDHSHEAAIRYNAAVAFVDADRGLRKVCKQRRPSEVLVWLCVNDDAFAAIGRQTNKSGDAAKTLCCKLLEVLALHYERVDEVRNRSTTAMTYEAALKRFDPKLD